MAKKLTNEKEENTEILVGFLYSFLDNLHRNNVDYALLHPGDDDTPDVLSDVDIVVSSHPRVSIEPTLRLLTKESNFNWVQSLHYDVPGGYYYVIQIPSPSGTFLYLQLDCIYDPVGLNRYHLAHNFLLKEKYFSSKYYRANILPETMYLLIKRAHKRNATISNCQPLMDKINILDKQLESHIEQWFGSDLKKKIFEYCLSEDKERFSQLINQSSRKISLNYFSSHPILAIQKLSQNIVRNIRRAINPTGLFVVLIGPDGCGKSTVSQELLTNMARSFRQTKHFHWRPKLFPKLGRSKKIDVRVATTESTKPPKKVKYGTFLSFVRFIYYYFDFILGYWFVIYPKKARTALIIGERYFLDILVHPERYGFNLSKKVIRFFSLFVPSPDATILLSGDPAVIYSRKAELDIETIQNQLTDYTLETPRWGKPYIADVNKSKIDVLRQIESFLGQILEVRQLRGKRSNSKRVYPTLGRPRLLIDPAIRKSDLDSLFKPASWFGKVAFSCFKYFPFSRLIFSYTHSGTHFKDFPQLAADHVIRKTLSDHNNLKISYYLGNGGPRTKYTAQVVTDQNTFYVKIGHSKISKDLIRKEKLALDSIQPALTGSVPCCVDFFEHDEWLFLFTTSLSDPHSNSSMELTPNHLQTVEKIFSSKHSKETLGAYFSRHDLDKRVAELESIPSATRFISNISVTITNLLNNFSEKEIAVGISHGDFVPWNILQNSSGQLYVYDWEYFSSDRAALTDLIHFIRSKHHFIYKHKPETTASYLLNDPHLKSYAKKLSLETNVIPFYISIYLIEEILRHAETGLLINKPLKDLSSQIEQIVYLGQCLHSVNESIRNNRTMRRICIAAYACEPDKGSEPGVGWNWINLAAQNNHVWVFTKHNNKQSIDRYILENPNDNLNFIYVNVPKWLSFWKHKQRGVRTYYYIWQFFALFKARSLNKTVQFDFSHHVTFVNDWLWSFIGLMPGKFIWGPIGSHPKIPKQLCASHKSWFDDLTRTSFQQLMRAIDPLFWITSIRASRILTINNEIINQFPLKLLGKNKCYVESAIAHESASELSEYNKFEKFTVLYVGRFHRTKCPHLAIEAFAFACKTISNCELIMVGRGPEENNLRKQAGSTDFSDRISFRPWCSQSEVLELMSKSHIFIFPSTEGGGMVVIEALSLGLPVVCLNYGGPGSMVNREVGELIEPGKNNDVVSGLGNAIASYYLDADKLNSHSKQAIKHTARNLSWHSKKVRIDKLYDEIDPPKTI